MISGDNSPAESDKKNALKLGPASCGFHAFFLELGAE
jgi:hypothetical protein